MILIKSIYKFKEIFLLPLVLLHLILLINTKFTLWPEMVVYPYLANNGFRLYQDIINPYPPAFLLFLNIFGKFFGYFPLPFQLLTWVIIVLCDFSIYITVLKITKNYYNAALASLFFVIFSVPFGINGLWFDLVQTPFLIFSIYYFYKYLNFKKIIDFQKSFYLVVISFFIKQQVLWIVIFYLAFIIVKEKARIFKIAKDLLYPFGLFCFLLLIQFAYFYKLGTLKDFIFWTIYQPLILGSSLPGYVLLPSIKQILIALIPLLFAWSMNLFSKPKNLILMILPVPLILFAFPRFDYFHLISYLAGVSLVIGVTFKFSKNSQIKQLFIPLGLAALLIIFSVHFFKSNWQQPVRFFERDTLSAAAFLDTVTTKDSLIYIQNGPDQLLPLADRLPPKPWAIQFPWYMEIGDLQSRTVASIRNKNPQFVVFKPYDQKAKYDLGSYRPTLIASYLDENYQNLIQINSTLWLRVKK